MPLWQQLYEQRHLLSPMILIDKGLDNANQNVIYEE